MQNATKKWPAILSAVILIVLIAMWIVILAVALLGNPGSNAPGIFVIGLYATIGAAVILGILIALRQRMKEISSGEEEEAKKY